MQSTAAPKLYYAAWVQKNAPKSKKLWLRSIVGYKVTGRGNNRVAGATTNVADGAWKYSEVCKSRCLLLSCCVVILYLSSCSRLSYRLLLFFIVVVWFT